VTSIIFKLENKEDLQEKLVQWIKRTFT
jgi:hypothetical protein